MSDVRISAGSLIRKRRDGQVGEGGSSTVLTVRTGGASSGGGQTTEPADEKKGFLLIAYADLSSALDASIYKNFKCSSVTGNAIINITGASDGDVGVIELIVDDTGGYDITMGEMFRKNINDTEIFNTAGSDNFIIWRKVVDDYVYEVQHANLRYAEAIISLLSLDSEGVTSYPAGTFSLGYEIENTGAGAGSGIIDWKITLDGEPVDEGSFFTPVVNAGNTLDPSADFHAPANLGEYKLWLKMRGDASYTLYVTLVVQFQVVIDAIDTIINGVNGSTSNQSIQFMATNVGETGNFTIIQRILDGSTLVSQNNYIYGIAAGQDEYELPLIEYPATPSAGLKLTLEVQGMSPEPFESNSFSSVEVVYNHIDTVNSPVPSGETYGFSFEIYAAGAVDMQLYWRLRTDLHQEISSGGMIYNLSAGTQTYMLGVEIPIDADGADRDWQIGRKNTVFELTSNHFTIT